MLKNYLIVAWRNLRRHKLYSLINILGLTVGMSCCVLLLLFVEDELSYDEYHEKAGQIYRVALESNWQKEKEDREFATTPASLAPALQEGIPGILQATRVDPPWSSGQEAGIELVYQDRRFMEKRIYRVEPNFFEVFSVAFLKGDPRSALSERQSIVLTQTMAQKYFGDEEPIGKVLNIPSQGDLKVTGVIADIPFQSHFRFDALTPWWQNMVMEGGEHYHSVYTYLLMEKGRNPEELERLFPSFVEHYEGYIWFSKYREDPIFRLFLQPLTEIHLYSHLENEIQPNQEMETIILFAGIALLVLFIACINYMNLATAQAAHRVREVGMRRVMGAQRAEIIHQFIGEAVVFALVAVLLSIALIELSLPFFNAFLQRKLHLDYLHHAPLLLLIALLTGCLAGSYPAFFLSAFQPVEVLKGMRRRVDRGAFLRRSLVIFQFAISVGLICVAGIMYWQMVYTMDKDLGFKGEQVLAFPTSYPRPQNWLSPENSFKRVLQGYPGIIGVSATGWSVLGLSKSTDTYYPEGMAGDQPLSLQTLYVDYDFIDLLEIKLAHGRDFSRAFTTDPTEAVILNEAAVQQLGWKDPLGKQIRTQVLLAPPSFTGKQQDDLEAVQVIGVVQDFHTESLYHRIEPLVLRMHLDQQPTTTVPIERNSLSYILVKVKPEDLRNTLAFIQEQWNKYTGGKAFDYFFLNEEFERAYREDLRLSQLFGVSALLSVFVACLGLFGLAAFTAEQRTKEIGIRKVLGASVPSIVALLSKEFTCLVLAANSIAWPVAYFTMNRWLQNFAYRIELGPGLFVLGGVLALGIAWLTVSYQAIRAARANPVEALRYE